MRGTIISFTLGLAVISSIGVLSGCAATGGDLDDQSSGKRDTPIINGQETSAYPAVGALLQQGEAFCTATLIAPRSVLTAAHCVDGQDATSFVFGLGPSQDQLDTEIQVVSAAQHPKYDGNQLVNDVAVVTLGEDAPVAAMPMNPTMDDTWVGRPITLVGYGVSDGKAQTGAGIKRMVEVNIDQVDAQMLHYLAKGGKAECNGDSGGPALVDVGGKIMTAGITSYGDEFCQQGGAYTRVDVFLDYINEQVAKAGVTDPNAPGGDPNDPGSVDPNDPGADPNDPGNDPNDPGGGAGCQGETWEGRCDGNEVIWCEEDEVQWMECDSCGYNDQDGYFDCMD
jgi:hypothetical protein